MVNIHLIVYLFYYRSPMHILRLVYVSMFLKTSIVFQIGVFGLNKLYVSRTYYTRVTEVRMRSRNMAISATECI